MKQTYSKPKLKVYGDLESLTQQGGGSIADMPIGIGDSIGPGNSSGS